MPSWDEVKEYVRGRFQILKEEDSWFGMAWRFPVGDGTFVTQRVKVHSTHAFGEAWLLAMADVVPEAQLDPREAIKHNRTLAIGALALDDGLYLMRHAAPLATLVWVDLDRMLEFVAHEAARLRLRVSGGHKAADGEAPPHQGYAE
jgi:hypothetical protein